MNNQDFDRLLGQLQKAVYHFKKSEVFEALEILNSTKKELEHLELPEASKKNLMIQIQGYCEAFNKVYSAKHSSSPGLFNEANKNRLDLPIRYRNAIALMNTGMWSEAMTEFLEIAEKGFQILDCREFAGDCAVNLQKWQEAMDLYEMAYEHPGIDSDTWYRIQGKMNRLRKFLNLDNRSDSEHKKIDINGSVAYLEREVTQDTPLRSTGREDFLSAPLIEEGNRSHGTDKDDLQTSLDYQVKLNRILKQIYESERFEDLLPIIEPQMLALLKAERMTVYQRGRHHREIVSRYKTGDDIKEIRLAFSASSIAGYVALSQRPLTIPDVYDAKYLASIHPTLKFDASYDLSSGFRTRSMVVVPIKAGKTLLGVLQVINKINGGKFTVKDLQNVQEMASLVGQKFFYELQATQHPFDYLIQTKKVKPERLEELKVKSSREKISLARLLITDGGLSQEEVGESLERYFQVPFMAYNSDITLLTTVI